ncbi:hypothetical protein ACFL27_03105 [candidate division CSSED10-310 bacterium]|uniref:Amidohydrolase n=1 Tax=candidate division CSSED10-310 bacterium TaxID=2855610 RepID=A0ABV6YSL8_UNCC1
MEIRAARTSCLPPVDDHFHLWGWADWLPAHAGLRSYVLLPAQISVTCQRHK